MYQELLRLLKKIPFKQLITIVLVVMAFLFLLNLNHRLTSVFSNRRAVETLQTEVVALYATDVALRTAVAAVQSEHVIEEYGRESGYKLENDVPVAVVGVDGSLPDLSTDDPLALIPQYENWELWWYLLFGKLFR